MEVGSSSLPGTTSPQGNVPQEDVSLPGTTSPQGNVPQEDVSLLGTTSPQEAMSQSDYILLFGGLAQLARALAWHARGHRFDSDILHVSACFLTAVGNHNYHLSPVNYPLRKSSLTY